MENLLIQLRVGIGLTSSGLRICSLQDLSSLHVSACLLVFAPLLYAVCCALALSIGILLYIPTLPPYSLNCVDQWGLRC